MNSNGTFIKPDDKYDDGCICFGPMDESQMKKYRNLPRYTVLPSDIDMNQSYSDDSDEDRKYAKSEICNENRAPFTSPYRSKFVPSVDLIDTATLNRYIHMETLSPAPFSSPYGSKCVPPVDLIDSATLNRYICRETLSPVSASFTTPCKSTFVPSVDLIDTATLNRYIRRETLLPDMSLLGKHNVIPFKGSIDEELDDPNLGDTFIVDKHICTPGKQQIFDSHYEKPSFRVRSRLISTPFRNVIEEVASPDVPKTIISKLVSKNVSYIPSEIEEDVEVSSLKTVDSSALDFNHETGILSNNYIVNETSITKKAIDMEMKVDTDEEKILKNNWCLTNSFLVETNILDVSLNDDELLNKSTQDATTNSLFITSHEGSENTLNSSSSEDTYITVIPLEEFQLFLKNCSTDQMNVTYLTAQSRDASSVSESFYSDIEINYPSPDENQKKTNPIQGNHDIEKQVKMVNGKKLETPSMQFNEGNFIGNSKKQLSFLSINKENDLKTSLSRQKLDLITYDENKAAFSISVNKKTTGVLGKHKIPNKVTDKSIPINEEFNKLSLLNSTKEIKPKKTVQKYKKLPVLSDVSNLSKK